MVAARYLWEKKQARPSQLPPSDADWETILFKAGRGWGKTRVGAEWLVWQALRYDKTRWTVVARTAGEVRDVCIEGESGLLEVVRRYGVLKTHNRSLSEIVLSNGSRIKGYTAEKPDSIRGSQGHGAWCDELSSWTKADSWDQLQFSLRLGKDLPDFTNQVIITTTPKPTLQFKALMADENVIKVSGTLEENRANLTKSFVKTIMNRYAGTRLWRQEGLGELLLDNPGALWTYETLRDCRIPKAPEMSKIVISVDPATTTTESSDSTGIIVAGRGEDGRGYVLEDRTCKMTADGWAKLVIRLFDENKANQVIVEGNQGGDAWEIILHQYRPTLPVHRVSAYQGKTLRAEPVAALYEQGRVSHVGVPDENNIYQLDQLEDQMITWVDKESDFSPDRIDALVHALTALGVGNESSFDAFLEQGALVCPQCRFPNRLGSTTCEGCNYKFEDEPPDSTGFPFSTP